MQTRLLASAVTLALGSHGALALATPDRPPTTPANLAARAYDATSGGVRWDRSSDDRGAVRGYEITRNGAVLGVRDTLSYVDQALRPGTTYTFGITAIDNAGQRSSKALARLTTPGGAVPAPSSPPSTPSAPVPTAGAPTPVGGLRSSVYSPTAAGIAWTRSAAPVNRYEVSRDGRVLTTTGSTSYVDQALSGGRSYTYTVVALDDGGRRSAPATVMFDTPAAPSGSERAPIPSTPTPPAAPTPERGVLPAAVQSRLETVFDIANGDAVELAFALGQRLVKIGTDGSTPGFAPIRTATNERGTMNTTLSCPAGGRLDVVTETRNPAKAPIYIGHACHAGPITFDGFFGRDPQSPSTAPASPEVDLIRGFRLLDSRDGTLTRLEKGNRRLPYLPGLGQRLGYDSFSAVANHDNPAASHTGPRSYVVVGPAAITQVYGDGGDRDTLLSVNFRASLGQDGGPTTVAPVEWFGGIDARGNFGSGRLGIRGPGFDYVLNAGNGDPASFQLDVTENGSTTSYTVPWSRALSFDAFEPGKVDLGF